MTYSALCCLLILGDTLASLDRARLARCVSRLQRDDGSFSASAAAAAAPDMKFSYCAVAVCYMLRHVEAIDARALSRYIQHSLVSPLLCPPHSPPISP
jgi:geranylgeranyl transferase type-1 subunit beta